MRGDLSRLTSAWGRHDVCHFSSDTEVRIEHSGRRDRSFAMARVVNY